MSICLEMAWYQTRVAFANPAKTETQNINFTFFNWIYGMDIDLLFLKKIMKNNLIIATAVVTGAAFVTYLLKRRKRNMPMPVQSGNGHHLTNVFANAKKHVSSMNSETL